MNCPERAGATARDPLQYNGWIQNRTAIALLDARAALGAKALVVDQKAEVDQATGSARVTLAVSTQIPRSADALRALRDEAQTLLRDETPTPPPAPSRPVQRTPLADVERRLREHGASKKLRERVLEGVVAREEREGSGHPLDLAASEVGSAFKVASLPLEKGRTTVLAFLGATFWLNLPGIQYLPREAQRAPGARRSQGRHRDAGRRPGRRPRTDPRLRRVDRRTRRGARRPRCVRTRSLDPRTRSLRRRPRGRIG